MRLRTRSLSIIPKCALATTASNVWTLLWPEYYSYALRPMFRFYAFH